MSTSPLSRGGSSTAELLRGVPLFAELEEPDLQKIARVAVPRSYPAGTIILQKPQGIQEIDDIIATIAAAP